MFNKKDEKKTKKVNKELKSSEVAQKIKKISDEFIDKTNWLKKKFDDADPETKKKIITGLSIVGAGLVALVGAKKSKSKK